MCVCGCFLFVLWACVCVFSFTIVITSYIDKFLKFLFNKTALKINIKQTLSRGQYLM